jgi:hypothetical protein
MMVFPSREEVESFAFPAARTAQHLCFKQILAAQISLVITPHYRQVMGILLRSQTRVENSDKMVGSMMTLRAILNL